jgi:FtsP/CotA-like multicopper oxidase with cupredoxin domain
MGDRSMDLTRRDFVKLGALGTAALALPLERTARSVLQNANRLEAGRFPAVGQLPFRVPVTARPTPMTVTVPGIWIDPVHPSGTEPVEVEIDYYGSHMQQVDVPIMPGLPPTRIWGYQGAVPGPTIHVQRGRPALVRHSSELADQHPVLRYGAPRTSVHLHGNASLPQHDGYASDTTFAPNWKDYWYPAIQDSRTLWYHDHGVHQTAPNAYMGLAGQYHLHDEVETHSGLPLRGAYDQYGNPYDVPLILRDAIFDNDGQLIYDDNEQSGEYGDVILVNGVPWPNMRVEPRQYRFRILDAAISRSFELALSVKGSTAKLPFLAVGTDGGIVEIAQQITALRIGMAERYEVVIDFSRLAGRTLVLNNLRPKNNIEYPSTGSVMQFTVGTTVSNRVNNATRGGRTLRERPYPMTLRETSSMPHRSLQFRHEHGHWTINGKTWDQVVNSGFTDNIGRPRLNDIEVWTIQNLSGGWFHPVHIHLIDFQILSRTGGKRTGVQPFERGPKDVVYTGEDETIKVIARFGPQAGRYMIHCHNLVHEDHDMMSQFWVEPPDGSPVQDYDPMGSRENEQSTDGSFLFPEMEGVEPQYPPEGA